MSEHLLLGPAHFGEGVLEEIARELSTLERDMRQAEQQCTARWQNLPAVRRQSARNLVHYMAMRDRDLRPLQMQLAALGLSSLGRAESQALPAVEAVRAVVNRLKLRGSDCDDGQVPTISSGGGRALLEANTRALLGPAPAGRDVRIMVTMPTEAAHDYSVVRDLLDAGMDCMRINAAHDDADAWDQMLRHLDRARAELGRQCRVLIDVAGPKLRTGPVEAVSPVARWRPDRDRYGRVVRPARVWLTARENPRPAPFAAAVILPVAGGWLSQLMPGDVVKLFDARDSMRELMIAERTDDGSWAESRQSAYVVPGTMLYVKSAKPQTTAEVGELPPSATTLQLAKGDTLMLKRQPGTGTPATYSDSGEVLQAATIGVTLPQALEDVRVGEPIWLDDGKIGGVIRAIDPSRVEVTITHARPGGSKLGADKGVNLPDSTLRLPALTDKDKEDLRFINGRADLVGYSFVRSEEDVRALQSHLVEVSAREIGVVLKIETRRAFEQLPALLIAAMHSPSSGVMIARGDLAVECGYERLAEVQEEILWMAEASHTPVIWATQVLENLAKDGVPSRAEITDAAMSERAECVMLNKGPYIVDAVRVLDDILTRMQAHQHKKSAMLRELAIARRFLSAAEPVRAAAS